MVLRKLTFDNSVRYIPEKEQTKKTRSNQKQQKLVHFLVNKTKIFLETLTIKSSLKK